MKEFEIENRRISGGKALSYLLFVFDSIHLYSSPISVY